MYLLGLAREQLVKNEEVKDEIKAGEEVMYKDFFNSKQEEKRGVILDLTSDYSALVKFEDGKKCDIGFAHLKLITPKPFTKSDLKDGMIVSLRNGYECIYFDGCILNSKFRHD